MHSKRDNIEAMINDEGGNFLIHLQTDIKII